MGMYGHLLRGRIVVPRKNAIPDGKVIRDTDVATDLAIRTADRAVCIDASNIANYVTDDQRQVTLLPATSDGMTPPWPICWIEWSWSWVPSAANALFEKVGYLVTTLDIEDVEARELPMKQKRPDARWLVTLCGPWVPAPERNAIIGPFRQGVIYLDDAGATVNGELRTVDLAWAHAHRSIAPKATPEWSDLGIKIDHSVIFHAFQFANCRNVEKIEVLPSRQQRRLAQRKGEPVHSHYVLAIDGDTQRKVYPKGERVPANRRLHICRGHFATYTEAAPLFGKLTGRFWVPAHVRGKADHGAVHKDYRIGKVAP